MGGACGTLMGGDAGGRSADAMDLQKDMGRGAWPRSTGVAALLILVVTAGSFFRLYGLGSRSLWADEFCTWHVSRMPPGESLRWGPELTKPPLYQFCLRALTREARPAEWMLRFPAFVAGVLTVLAAFLLARLAGSPWTALCASALVACHAMQIRYSQDARPYAFLVLGATLSTVLWHRVVTRGTRGAGIGYVLVTALSFYAHYLTLLVILSHLLWWCMVAGSGRRRNIERRPLGVLVATAGLCAPMVWHYLTFRTSVFQGLAWIRPPTWVGALEVLGQITFGPLWVVGVLAPALAAWGFRALRAPQRPTERAEWAECAHPTTLLVAWLTCSWFGLLLISWIAHPAMVARYALPAGIAGIVLPVLVAERVHRGLPVVLAILFVGVGLRDWSAQSLEVDPGFRELSAYLAATVDPQRELIVLTIDGQTHPDWDDAERLPFQYYPVKEYPIHELHLAPDGVTVENDILRDPRAMYLVVLWTDPFAILERAGRHAELIQAEGRSFKQLLFSPYRLVRVAAKNAP